LLNSTVGVIKMSVAVAGREYRWHAGEKKVLQRFASLGR
jgi:hypothetical protein